jgi:glycosyltransferase involved in cell wall biosynthesis
MKVVWHCEDRAGPSMAGPAIRAATLAARLAARHDVLLLCPGATALPERLRLARGPGSEGRGLQVAELEPGRSLFKHLEGADALVTQGFGFAPSDLARLPEGLRFVLDLYDPVLLELLQRAGADPGAGERLHLAAVRLRLLWMLGRADHVLCASPAQRLFWLGWLGAAGRLLPSLHEADPQAGRLLSLVPFGIEPPAEGGRPAADPAAAAALLREVAPGDLPLLWWGGLWDWMDPACALRAVARLRSQGARVSLVLPASHPAGGVSHDAGAKAEAEARHLGLWGSGVSRLPAWVPFEERGALLRAAWAAVTCHRPSLESDLAFRTRLLDCVWAGLPVACSSGDALSARGAEEGWAKVAPPGDDEALAARLALLLDPAAHGQASAAALKAAPAYGWDRSARVLLDLLEGPPSPRPASGPLPELRGAGAGALLESAAGKLLGRLRKL